MDKILDWDEIGDGKITDEVEVVWLVFPYKNMCGDRITFWFSNAMYDGRPISLTSDNENDGTSATPWYYCEGHHTKEEFLANYKSNSTDGNSYKLKNARIKTEFSVKKYHYLWAWCKMMGSRDYYVQGELKAAIRDDAPEDVIYRTNGKWKRFADIKNVRTRQIIEAILAK